jgi:hypothetical protein
MVFDNTLNSDPVRGLKLKNRQKFLRGNPGLTKKEIERSDGYNLLDSSYLSVVEFYLNSVRMYR